jgi:hypothetical protein
LAGDSRGYDTLAWTFQTHWLEAQDTLAWMFTTHASLHGAIMFVKAHFPACHKVHANGNAIFSIFMQYFTTIPSSTALNFANGTIS